VDITVTRARLSGIQSGATSNSTVRRTRVTDATAGVVCFEADRNILSGNAVAGCEGSGIDLLDTRANLIVENVSNGNDEHGLALTNSDGNAVRKTRFRRTTSARVPWSTRRRISSRGTIRGATAKKPTRRRDRSSDFPFRYNSYPGGTCTLVRSS